MEKVKKRKDRKQIEGTLSVLYYKGTLTIAEESKSEKTRGSKEPEPETEP